MERFVGRKICLTDSTLTPVAEARLLPIQTKAPDFLCVSIHHFEKRFIRNPERIDVPKIDEQNPEMTETLDQMNLRQPFFQKTTWFYWPKSQLYW